MAMASKCQLKLDYFRRLHLWILFC